MTDRPEAGRPEGGQADAEQPVTERAIRIGAVSYLNTRALIYGLQRGVDPRVVLTEDVPAALARQMVARQLDVALLPIAALVLPSALIRLFTLHHLLNQT